MKSIITSTFFLMATLVQAQDTLSKKDIPAAARLFDLNFTQKEIDSMYAGVKENVGVYQRMHKQTLANNIVPTLSHSAILPGMVFNEKQEKIEWNIPKNVVLPADKNELAWYSVAQLASLLKNKKISSVELTKFFIERIKKYGDSLQCVISVTEEMAMAEAAKADAEIAAGKYKGLLHGVPYGLKDLFAVRGTKTTWGQNKKSLEHAFWFIGFIGGLSISNCCRIGTLCHRNRNMGFYYFTIINLWSHRIKTHIWCHQQKRCYDIELEP